MKKNKHYYSNVCCLLTFITCILHSESSFASWNYDQPAVRKQFAIKNAQGQGLTNLVEQRGQDNGQSSSQGSLPKSVQKIYSQLDEPIKKGTK